MTEIQRVVDELRFLLQREVIDQTDELAALVVEYSGHCHSTNARLRKCDECLKQGLRAEALQLAEAAPNLLDLVAVLDFAERPQLMEVVATYFFSPPEPLLLDIASALNEGYALQEPLLKLLDTQRLLALGRCSFAQRLPVLWSLAQLDPTTPHWDSDVRDMERARLGEMETEVRAAASRGDMPALKSLLAETQAEHWRESIPESLLKAIKSRVTQAQRTQSRGRLEELEAELHAAFNARDVDRARSLRDDWNRELKAVPLPVGDPLREQVAPILNWLDDEDRSLKSDQEYAKSVTEIERAVTNDALTLVDLKRMGLEFDRHQRSLPEGLEARFARRIADQAAKEKSRRTFKIASMAAGVIAVVGAFGWIVQVSNEGEKDRRIAAAVSAFVSEGKLAEARQLMAQRGSKSTSELWLGTQKLLTDAERAEQDRVVQFQAAVETAEQSTEAVRIESAIKQADGLAQTADEKVRVDKVRATWQDRVTRETAEREKEFRELLASANQPIQSVETALRDSTTSDLDHSAQLLSEAGTRVSQFQSAKGSVAKELQNQAAAMETRLEAARKGVADLRRKHDLLDRLTHAVLLLPTGGQTLPKAGTYEATLREFATVFPEDVRAKVMKTAAEVCPLPAVLSRQKLIEQWKSLKPASDKHVDARLREIRTLLIEHPNTPDLSLITRYQTWLNAVQLRFVEEGDPDQGLKQKLIRLFNGKFVKEAHILRDTDGRTFYLTEARTEPFGSVASFRYVVDYNGTTKVTKDLKPSDVSMFKSVAPPQQELATKTRTILKDVGIDNWHSVLREITETWLKATPVDPLLRYRTVTQVLDYAASGDQLLALELAPVFKAFDDEDKEAMKAASWMDPYSTKVEEYRKRATSLLSKVPPLEPIFANAVKRQTELERDVLALRFSIGWLEKSARGEWTCRTKWAPVTNNILHVVSRPDATGNRQWLEVGRVQGGALKIDSLVADSVGEAAVVFTSLPK